MARSRNIKPGFFTNGDLLECSPLARLLFAGLWCEADRRGILKDQPKSIKVKVLPGDNCDANELLDELAERGFIERYAVNGERCIWIVNFQTHQNPHTKERASTLPAPPEHAARPGMAPDSSGDETDQEPDKPGASPVQAPDKHHASPADSLNPESLNPATSVAGGCAHTRVEPEPVEKPKPKRRERIPDDFDLDDDLFAYGEKLGFCRSEIEAETEKFRLHHRAKGTLMLEWHTAWQGWMRRALEYRGNLSPFPTTPPPVKPKSTDPIDIDPILRNLARQRKQKVTGKLGVVMPSILERYDAEIAELDTQLKARGSSPEEAERWALRN